jgi:hypothetical protein
MIISMECRYVHIVSMCGSLQDAKGAAVRLVLYQKAFLGSIWLICLMSHMGPYSGRCPGK